MAGRFHRAGNDRSFWAGGACLALARRLANAKVLGDLAAFAYRDLRFYGVAAAALVASQGIVDSRNMKRRLDARLPEAVPMSRKIRPISPRYFLVPTLQRGNEEIALLNHANVQNDTAVVARIVGRPRPR